MKKMLMLAALFGVIAGCGSPFNWDEGKKREKTSSDETDRFSLVPEQDLLGQSKFCGDVRPDLPEDPTPPYRFDQQLLQEKLTGLGLTGWMHGVVAPYQHFLFTYRSEDRSDPMAFFKAEQISLSPGSEEVAEIFASLHRHDKVTLKGALINADGPLRHIIVTSMTVDEVFEQPTDNPYDFDLSVLKGNERFDIFGKVHAVVHSEKLGSAFVLEYENFMLPIAVDPRHQNIGATLFRNDIVHVSVKMEHSNRNRPPHFSTDPEVESAIKMVDTIANCHGVPRTLEGFLVKFVKSPAISTDVYAVRIVDANGIGRNFTFFPDSDDPEQFMALFMGLKTKAEAAWNGSTAAEEVVRNYHKKAQIRVKATGKMNVISTEQANPQIYLKSVDDLEISY